MRGVLVAKRKTVVDFGLVSCRRVSKAKPPQVLAKRRTVVAFGLVSCRRVSKVPTVTGMRGVLVEKRSQAQPGPAAQPSPAQLSPARQQTQPSLAQPSQPSPAQLRPSDVVHSHDYSFGRMNMPFLLLIFLMISALRLSAFGFVAPIRFFLQQE